MTLPLDRWERKQSSSNVFLNGSSAREKCRSSWIPDRNWILWNAMYFRKNILPHSFGDFCSSAQNTFVLMFDSEFVIIESLGVIHTAQCDILYRYTSLWYYTELMLFPSEWFKFWLWSVLKDTFACNHSFQGHIYLQLITISVNEQNSVQYSLVLCFGFRVCDHSLMNQWQWLR